MQQKFNPQNETILVSVNGKLMPRNEARISVFDSAVQGGDAVWEGLRVYNGRIFCLEEHLNRLQESAHALMFQEVPSKQEIKQIIIETLQANGMRDGAHIRLTLTRGEKITSGMDPRLNQKGCTLIVLAEWKKPVYGNESISLITASVRRNSPLNIDSKIHHNNLINNILAKIEANIAGADDALMLDNYGFLAETNACNIFMVKNETLITPHADACLPGITRGKVLAIADRLQIRAKEKNISLTELYNADTVFTSGTMGELTRVKQIDGRMIVDKTHDKVFEKIAEAFRLLTETEGELLPF
ncbi:MAG: aminotransferase class IV [Chitinophagales bacterium]|nr:aminotransferase class IV [Chitinophagales bacterium]